jgi:polysaccharide pyruvyl transferase WcaK-like protein
MTKNALLICESRSDNLGDQAIADAVAIGIEAEGYEVETTDFSCRSSYLHSRKISFVEKVFNKFAPQIVQGIIWSIRNFYCIYNVSNKKHDIVIIGGGQLIHSNINFPFAFFAWSFFNRKKRVYVLGCGCDKQFKNYEICLFKKSFKHIKKGYLRDFDSIHNAKNIFDYEFFFAPDIAYLLREKVSKNDTAIRKTNIGISVIDHKVYLRYADEVGNKALSKEEYIDYWCEKIISLSTHYECIHFLSTTSSDHKFSSEVKNELESLDIDKKIKICMTDSWRSFIKQLKEVDLYFSGRMHGLILARIVDVKFLPYVVSNKIRVFNDELEKLEIKEVIEIIKLSLAEICNDK